jgi:hypothetical protein
MSFNLSNISFTNSFYQANECDCLAEFPHNSLEKITEEKNIDKEWKNLPQNPDPIPIDASPVEETNNTMIPESLEPVSLENLKKALVEVHSLCQTENINPQFQNILNLAQILALYEVTERLVRILSSCEDDFEEICDPINIDLFRDLKNSLKGVKFLKNALEPLSVSQENSNSIYLPTWPSYISSLTFEIARYFTLGHRFQKINKKMEQGGQSKVTLKKIQNVFFVIKDLNIYKQNASSNYCKELQAIYRITFHENIIPLIGKKIKKLLLYFPYCAKGDLIQALSIPNHGLDKKQIIFQILLAIKHLHHHQPRPILHNDLKHENVFITENNTVMIGDFGLSHYDGENRRGGTPSFQSPEIFKERGSVSLSSDIFSLGFLIYAILTDDRYGEFDHILDLIENLKQNNPFLQSIPLRKELPITNPLEKAHFMSLLSLLLSIDPENRPTIEAILHHPLFIPYYRAYLQQKGLSDSYMTPSSSPSPFQPLKASSPISLSHNAYIADNQ